MNSKTAITAVLLTAILLSASACGDTQTTRHYTFRKPGKNPITIPKHEPIKTVYVKMVREIIESEASDN